MPIRAVSSLRIAKRSSVTHRAEAERNMTIVRLDSFERALKRFPKDVRELAERQIRLLEAHPRDLRLHLKKLHRPLEGVYSFRITRNYRALFYFDANNNIIIFETDDRKDVYR